ncbi:MAG: hypothetical protein ABI907_04460, partial [Ramlibacter sp.]
MKYLFFVPMVAVLLAAEGHAQVRSMYRCAGNFYTNNLNDPLAKGCKLVEGGNVTVVEGTRVQGAAGASPVRVATASGNANQRVDSADQKARDSDARQILESELKKAVARQAELVKEYNNGEPEMLGPEHRNHQKYLDRVAELKTSIARNDGDIAGI